MAATGESALVPTERVARWAVLLGVFVVAQIVTALYALIEFLPAGVDIGNGAALGQRLQLQRVGLFGAYWDVRPEQIFLVLVIAGGALGSGVGTAASFTKYVGERRLRRQWIPYYVFRLPIGVGLPLIVYAGIRGGILNLSAGGSDLNPYGIVLVGGVTGMFSQQFLDKLQEWVEGLGLGDGGQPEAAGSQLPAGSKPESEERAGR